MPIPNNSQNKDGGSSLTNAMNLIIKYFVMTIWAAVGILLWIPLLLRMISIYFAAVTASMYRKVNIVSAQKRLNYAIAFYASGFARIRTSFDDGEIVELDDEHEPMINNFQEFGVSVAKDLIFTVIFWASVIFFALHIF